MTELPDRILEIFDIPHVTAARDLFIDIPGPETSRLAALARQYDTYIVAQCKARWPEVIDKRFFNTLFVISRQGEIVHKAMDKYEVLQKEWDAILAESNTLPQLSIAPLRSTVCDRSGS